MKLEIKDQKKIFKYINLITTYLKEHDDSFTYNEKERIKVALCNFSAGYNLYDYLCLQICDELGLLPDDQNPYKAFSDTLNEEFNVENKRIKEIGGGKLLRIGKRVANIQNMGTITIYNTNSIIKDGDYPNLRVVKKRFKDSRDANSTDVLVGLLAYTSAPVVVKTAIDKNIDFMIALFDKQNPYLFCEGNESNLNQLDEFDNTERDILNSNLGKLKVKRLKEIGEQYPIIYNDRG